MEKEKIYVLQELINLPYVKLSKSIRNCDALSVSLKYVKIAVGRV